LSEQKLYGKKKKKAHILHYRHFMVYNMTEQSEFHINWRQKEGQCTRIVTAYVRNLIR